ncbi:hypothetical protein IMSHALPRED_010146 [Imshaugia aleurites]|uniref:Uncharacterized protein n=1 Tax=Imshaugia aleurites TaxID=172621 RepID=A0A8H3G221_9LECA|nr:hypothetical protein IMSHALPRED_010146 [Imshaugia aleurites]
MEETKSSKIASAQIELPRLIMVARKRLRAVTDLRTAEMDKLTNGTSSVLAGGPSKSITEKAIALRRQIRERVQRGLDDPKTQGNPSPPHTDRGQLHGNGVGPKGRPRGHTSKDALVAAPGKGG